MQKLWFEEIVALFMARWRAMSGHTRTAVCSAATVESTTRSLQDRRAVLANPLHKPLWKFVANTVRKRYYSISLLLIAKNFPGSPKQNIIYNRCAACWPIPAFTERSNTWSINLWNNNLLIESKRNYWHIYSCQIRFERYAKIPSELLY